MRVLDEAFFPELPNYYRGKVRENYDLPDGRRIIITTDRTSAFDRVLASIPHKGAILTQIARFWFEETADIAANHVVAYPDPNVVVGKRLDILPVEIIVRGYLAGTTDTSILTRYKRGERKIYGITFPDGMRDNEALPAPIITPTSKAFDGGHDEPLTPEEIVVKGLLTQAEWDEVSATALKLFARGQEIAAKRGLILADTKYEFGKDADGNILLADEIHTPDSSRYWMAESYGRRFSAGERPESFDKDFIRSWVVARCDPYKDPIPEIPEDVVLAASDVYGRAFEMITGKPFVADESGDSVKARIRANLQAYYPDGDWG
ncbi:phosphoribosylaminoimidazolesuccinocarboxamide synthase [Martelella mediterranea]|uniref:Phosphoribosylaminoimidazole-succinocarboxamide synthase n=1 Tax=Martelella mediterranea DSM 17316 TaxID=1122214 RepID=A0A1U9YX05_9HYPH|nr:phosphoribosylaminoimidazolesuccinocarboxamide synthase [Martelella mediterranea]AQZ49966.1 Phosphoribosylaminoimidazole-succinocarboxamide synthase [Martelella mediterranea DSM 17316]